MYSSEIEKFLKERDYLLTPEECNKVMDISRNPQINHMKYFCGDNEYHISTDDGYYFVFKVKWLKGEIEMTVNEVLRYNSIIKTIVDHSTDVSALVKFRFLGMLKQFQPIVEDFEKIRQEKIVQYANVTEDDGTVGIVEPKQEDYENDEDFNVAHEKFMECRMQFEKDINELANSEADIEIKKFKYTDIIDAGISADYLIDIYDLIEEWLGGID